MTSTVTKIESIFGIHDVRAFHKSEQALNYLQKIYDDSTSLIKEAFKQALSGEIKDAEMSHACYPYIGFYVDAKDLSPASRQSYGAVSDSGYYGGTITRPDLFHDYLQEQLDLLIQNHGVTLYVGRSRWPIPLPFAVEHSPSNLESDALWEVQNAFVLPNLSRIDDKEANCENIHQKVKPVSLFSGERVDYSLHRLQHYTATNIEDFQGYILLTNYQRYIDAFIKFGESELLKEDTEYTEFVGPNGFRVTKNGAVTKKNNTSKNLPQMPAYHLKRADGQGITFINIGVGPSNAKTITDHLAVLRPHCWIMLGHCAGLRSTQKLGDYVLAHAYVREDHVLDADLPLWVPVPALAEIQVALQDAVFNITHETPGEIKGRMRTGTVLTTDNRNWELQSRALIERFRQSRSIAVDMESATVSANGFRFRVPYGTLLCVSDKPIHGEIKLQGVANTFYKQRVRQHLEIGLETIKLLRSYNKQQLHSRKLRGFDEPPFR
ncbi:MAG: AMP nucleosidase [Candidatus Puniceispirillum sp.]|nr:AMP nucleosidase [Candidatus Pelagibacter sp.]MBA4282869.1 AMP nucleosidase [Candidatus Puniceispirillum sp.]